MTYSSDAVGEYYWNGKTGSLCEAAALTGDMLRWLMLLFISDTLCEAEQPSAGTSLAEVSAEQHWISGLLDLPDL